MADNPTCPNCGSDHVTESNETSTFDYGVPTSVPLTVTQPVMRCGECQEAWTDYRGEDAREAVIAQYRRVFSREPTPMNSLIIPTVHLNGTGKEELINQLMEAGFAVRKASEALAKARPHGRDYYVQADPDALTKAIDQHDDRMRKLRQVYDELEHIAVKLV